MALNADLPDIYSRKDRDRLRRWTTYEPKRSSTRLEAKRQQRLQYEEITQEQKARHDKFLEYKRRQEEIIAKEKERLERSERVKRREGRLSSVHSLFTLFPQNVQIVFVVEQAVDQRQVLMGSNSPKIAIHHPPSMMIPIIQWIPVIYIKKVVVLFLRFAFLMFLMI